MKIGANFVIEDKIVLRAIDSAGAQVHSGSDSKLVSIFAIQALNHKPEDQANVIFLKLVPFRTSIKKVFFLGRKNLDGSMIVTSPISVCDMT